MPVPLARAVRMARHQEQAHHGKQIWHRRQQARGGIAHAKLLDDGRQPQRKAVDAERERQEQQRQRQHAHILERLERVAVRLQRIGGVVCSQLMLDPRAVGGGQPPCMRGGFRQHAQRGQAQQDGRQAAPHEQHLPARQAERAGHRQQPPRHRPRDDERDRLRQHQRADDACAMAHRKPLGQEVQDAGVQAGFGRTEQKAQHVEADGPAHQRHGHGDHAPGEQDAREPATRAKAFQRQVARYFA